MSLRALRRAVALGFILAFCVLRYWSVRLRGPLSLERRALWLHTSACMVLDSLGIRCRIEGRPPARGLVVSNHLSYLDILVLSAAMPCFFVAKAEIGGWPFFGKAARTGGTIFLDRSSRASAEYVAGQIAERLNLPVPLLLFPEGTSTDGSRMLRFHSRLFEPAVAAAKPITAAAVRYVAEGGVQERELCWFADGTFLPHLWKTLGIASFSAEVRFAEPRVYFDRCTAASQTHVEIAAMRKGSDLLPQPPL